MTKGVLARGSRLVERRLRFRPPVDALPNGEGRTDDLCDAPPLGDAVALTLTPAAPTRGDSLAVGRTARACRAVDGDAARRCCSRAPSVASA